MRTDGYLAEKGIRFTQFFNSGRSCPSRASLLTGLYAQQVGITGMGLSLNKECVTIPELTLNLYGVSLRVTTITPCDFQGKE